MKTQILFVTGIALAVALTTSGAEARSAGAIGNNVGTPFTINCETGRYFAAISYDAGKALDEISVLCATNDDNQNDMFYPGKAGGGGGDGFPSLICPVGYAIRSMVVDTDKFLSIHDITLNCYNRHGAGQTSLTTLNTGGEVFHTGTIQCGSGEIATGIYGYATQIINQIGLKCNPR